MSTTMQNYRRRLSSLKKLLYCRDCLYTGTAIDLETHRYSVHLPNPHCCPWCPKEPRYTWPVRQKGKHIHHVLSCFLSYKPDHLILPAPPPPPQPDIFLGQQRKCLLKDALTAPARDLAGRQPLTDRHPFFYEHAFLPPAGAAGWWNPMSSPNRLRFLPPDQLGITYLRCYPPCAPVQWFHLIVRARALGCFFDCVQQYREAGHGVFLLEFSCWCDGDSSYTDPLDLYHRHMVAVAQNGAHFLKTCWRQVKVAFKPTPFYKCKECRVITSWRHLRNTLFYVSSPQSSCELRHPSKTDPSIRNHHFYLFHPVTESFKLATAVAQEDRDGLRELITEQKGQCQVTPFASYCVKKRPSPTQPARYAVKIQHVFREADERDRVVPVEPGWYPTGRVTAESSEAFLSLCDGHKLHFEREEGNESQSREEWIDRQGAGGNCFWEQVKDVYWFPPRNQQRVLNEVVPLVRREAELQREKERMTRLLGEKDRENERLKGLLEERDAELKEFLKDSNAYFKKELERQRESYERQIRDLKAQYEEQLRLQKEAYEKEIENLKVQWKQQAEAYEREIENLKEQLRQQKEAYEREIYHLKEQLRQQKESHETNMHELREELKQQKESYERDMQVLRIELQRERELRELQQQKNMFPSQI